MYRQEMDADKLLIYLPRIYCVRVLFACIVCIRQFRYTTCILVACFDIDICILPPLSRGVFQNVWKSSTKIRLGWMDG